jgi:hypothetical protein
VVAGVIHVQPQPGRGGVAEGSGPALAGPVLKRYQSSHAHPYWYSYYPKWDKFLCEGTESFLVLGCADLPLAFAVPYAVVQQNLSVLNRSANGHWQMNVVETGRGYALLLPGRAGTLQLTSFLIDLNTGG